MFVIEKCSCSHRNVNYFPWQLTLTHFVISLLIINSLNKNILTNIKTVSAYKIRKVYKSIYFKKIILQENSKRLTSKCNAKTCMKTNKQKNF